MNRGGAALAVALDVHALQVDGYADRGVGRYVAGYARALQREGVVAAALLAPELQPPRGMPTELVVGGLTRWDSLQACRDVLDGGEALVHHVTAPFLHCGPGDPSWLALPEHWALAGVPRAVLLYDLIPLRAPRHYLAGEGMADRYRRRAEWVAEADVVLAISSHTRHEAIDLLGCRPEAVVDIGAGVSPYFSGPDGTDEELWRFHLPTLADRPHLLTVGGSDARKGTERLISALALLVARGVDLGLLVVGHLTPDWRRRLSGAAQASGVADRVVLAGAVDDELLRACYRRADLTVMPSLAEGAGLPVLESAACGTPAVASAGTALSQTAASPHALFDPTDTGSIASTVEVILSDGLIRREVLAVQSAMARAATWEAVARRAVVALRRVVQGATPIEAPAVRVAVVGEGAPIDATTCGPLRAVIETFGAGGGFGIERRAASFDHVVYLLDPPEGWVLDAAVRFPGWLWLGDGTPGVPLEPLVRRSRGILVSSEAAARRVRLRLRPLAAEPPLVVGDGPEPVLAALLERAIPAPASVGVAPAPADRYGDDRHGG